MSWGVKQKGEKKKPDFRCLHKSQKKIQKEKEYIDFLNKEIYSIVEKFFNKEFDNTLNIKEKIKSYENDSRTVKECLKEEEIEEIKTGVKNYLPKVLQKITVFCESEDTKFDIEIKTLLSNLIENNFGKFVGAFINIDNVYSSLKEQAKEYIQNNPQKVEEKVFEKLENIMEKEVKDVTYVIPFEFIADRVLNMAKDKSLIQVISDKVVTKILTTPLKEIGNKFESIKPNIEKNVESILKSLIEKGSNLILKDLKINELVENKINEFPLKQIEDIVVGVSKKELKSITIVGGVLGFVIGLLPLLGKLI